MFYTFHSGIAFRVTFQVCAGSCLYRVDILIPTCLSLHVLRFSWSFGFHFSGRKVAQEVDEWENVTYLLHVNRGFSAFRTEEGHVEILCVLFFFCVR
jgi:hypothetical protein